MATAVALSSCAVEVKEQGPAKAPRALVAANIYTGGAGGVASKLAVHMRVLPFIGSGITKEPILDEINSDDGPEGSSGKPFFRLLYTMTHGGIDAAGGQLGPFLGPAIPSANPQRMEDKYIGADEIHLPMNHRGYDLVFFNGCRSADGNLSFKPAFKARRYMGWRNLAFGPTANAIQPVFGDAAADYMKKRIDNHPAVQGVELGDYVRSQIIRWWNREHDASYQPLDGDLLIF